MTGNAASLLVEMEQIEKSFGDKKVLKGVTLKLAPGEIASLMGPSGCGKTTVLRIIIHLISADQGSLSLFGSRLPLHPRENELLPFRRRMGILFQGGALFDSMTIRENLFFPLRYCLGMKNEEEMAPKAEEMLRQVELEGVMDLYPAELSGGMRKRAALARALIYRPDLLLLDEPTTGLDPQTARHVDRLVFGLGRKLGIGVLSVTHDLVSALGISDRILLMDQGVIAWEGTPEEWSTSQNEAVLRFAQGMVAVREGRGGHSESRR